MFSDIQKEFILSRVGEIIKNNKEQIIADLMMNTRKESPDESIQVAMNAVTESVNLSVTIVLELLYDSQVIGFRSDSDIVRNSLQLVSPKNVD